MNLRIPNLFKTLKAKLFSPAKAEKEQTKITDEEKVKRTSHGGYQSLIKNYNRKTGKRRRKIDGQDIIHCFGTFTPCRKFRVNNTLIK